MNVSKIVEKALKKLGVLASGEKSSAEEVADALDDLKALLAQWATQRMLVHKATLITIPLKGAGTYQVGKIEGDCCEYEISCCGDVLTRPDVKAEISHISDRAWLDDDEITMVRDTNNTASNVRVWYEVDHPNWLFHVKSCAKELKIKTYTLPYDLCFHDELHIPAHYERALVLALALEIAPMFGVEPSQLIYTAHSQAMTILKRSNSTPLYSKNDLRIGVGRYGCH